MICKKLFCCRWTSGKRRYLCQLLIIASDCPDRRCETNEGRMIKILLVFLPFVPSPIFLATLPIARNIYIHVWNYAWPYMHILDVAPIIFLFLIVVSGCFFTFSKLCFSMAARMVSFGFVVVLSLIIINSWRSARCRKAKRAFAFESHRNLACSTEWKRVKVCTRLRS